MSVSGALFDMVKLLDVSKLVISITDSVKAFTFKIEINSIDIINK